MKKFLKTVWRVFVCVVALVMFTVLTPICGLLRWVFAVPYFFTLSVWKIGSGFFRTIRDSYRDTRKKARLIAALNKTLGEVTSRRPS